MAESQPNTEPLREHSDEGAEPGLASEIVARLARRPSAYARYQLEGEIARGGMGAILRIWDEDLRRHLAMKVILGQAGAPKSEDTPPPSAETVARFLEEAQVTGQLDHPGVVPVHELGLDPDGRVYFTMKLVQGQTLKDVFDHVAAGREGWTQTRALGVLLKVCEAMAYAHDKGVIHRDLKPGNVMVGKFGEVHVMDWGLARILGQRDARDLRIRADPGASRLHTDREVRRAETPDSPLYTMDGDVVGTPAYMSPEQAAGELDEMGPHSDVYAMGAMLYHLLAGHMPYVPKTKRLDSLVVWGLVQQGPPTPIVHLAPGTPAELVAICEKAMAREGRERYRDMSALAADLSAYLEHRVVRAYRTGAWAEMKKWVERNRSLAASLVAGVLALVVGLIVSVSLERTARANELAARREKASVLRLSAFQKLDDLTRAADGLWPAEPERVEDYRAWLLEAGELVDQLPEFRALRAELAQRAAPSEEERWWQAQMAKLVAALEAFADEATGLVRGLSAEHGWGIQRRLDFAASIGARSTTSAEAARRWSEALASIASSERYRGSSWPDGKPLTPQLGLVPLAQDPESGLWQFAHLQSGTPARLDADGKLALDADTGLVLVLIPGGSFHMGAQSTRPGERNYDPQATSDESPEHELTLAPYFLSKYEMTHGQWQRCSGGSPSYLGLQNYGADWNRAGKPWSALHPVEQVSWNECAVLLARMQLVLPTEAQWEYACRAGTTGIYWCDDDPERLREAGNVADAYAKAHGGSSFNVLWSPWDDGNTAHAEVGSYRANPFGLFDVLGNAYEWCRDGFGAYTLPVRAGDGERQVPSPRTKVIRGGSFFYPASSARSAYRNGYAPDYKSFDIGLRPARVVNP